MESIKIVLQKVGKWEECGVPYEKREMVVHTPLALPINAVKKNARVTNKVATFLGNSSLQEYKDRPCNTVFPLVSIMGEKKSFINGTFLLTRNKSMILAWGSVVNLFYMKLLMHPILPIGWIGEIS